LGRQGLFFFISHIFHVKINFAENSFVLLKRKEVKMKKREKKTVSRVEEIKRKEEEVKKLLFDEGKRKIANKEIRNLLSQFKNRYSILDCLEVIRRRYPSYVLEAAIERVERKKKRNELSWDEIVYFEKFKKSLN